MKIAYIKVAAVAIFGSILFFPSYHKLESTGDNIFTVYLNDKQVGIVEDPKQVDRCLIAARKRLAGTSDELVLADSELRIEGSEVLWGKVDDLADVTVNMTGALRGSVKETLNRSYTVKINEYTVNLASTEEVLALLQASINRYDLSKRKRRGPFGRRWSGWAAGTGSCSCANITTTSPSPRSPPNRA